MIALLLLVAFVLWVYYYVYKPTQYWKLKGVKYSGPVFPFFGNMAGVMFRQKSFAQHNMDLYKEFPSDRFNGTFLFTFPFLLVRDLDLLRKITIKDFDHFTDRFGLVIRGVEPLLDRNVLSLQGYEWKQMRATLSPAFTGSKMRGMFPLITDCAKNFTNYFSEQEDDMAVLEMKNVLSMYANDVIGSVAFGLDLDSLRQPENPFRELTRTMIEPKFSQLLAFGLLPTKLALALGFRILDPRANEFFTETISKTIKHREKTGTVRPDMIHLLLEARKGRLQYEHEHEHCEGEGFSTAEASHIDKAEDLRLKHLSDEDITAQAMIFYIAGFETVSTVLAFMAYELAANPDVQAKLHEEIDSVMEKCNGTLTYEAVTKMKYLDQVISETIRLWPPTVQNDRVCTKDYVVEPVNPSEKQFVIEKGTNIVMPVYGIHRNPEYFPNPTKFDPERFSEENKSKIIPGSYFPFGSGPRNCIGSRLALLETKTLFCHLLSKFELVAVEKTHIPMKLSEKHFVVTAKDGMWIGLKKRKVTSL